MTRLTRELLEAVVLALLVFFVIHVSVQNFQVVGASMQDTLDEGQYLLVNKLTYQRIDIGRLAQLIPIWDVEEPKKVFAFHPPERGDVIVFHPPRDPDHDFVKRVIGLPGEVVEISNGQVYINGLPLDEPYAANVDPLETRRFPQVQEKEYFVMGDNRGRGSSNDSRDWGTVPLENIIGKVWVVYWPFSDFGTPSGFD